MLFSGVPSPLQATVGSALQAVDRWFPDNPISGLRGTAGAPSPAPLPWGRLPGDGPDRYSPPGYAVDADRVVAYVPAERGRLEYFPVPGRSDINPRDQSVGQGDGRFQSFRGNAQQPRLHNGIDYAAPVGTPIVAASNGVVTRVTKDGGFGRRITVDHGGGLESVYAHLNDIDVQVGQKVKGGHRIGYTGRTGNVPEKAQAHLHYEVRQNGKSVDPQSRTSSDYSKVVNPMLRDRIIWD